MELYNLRSLLLSLKYFCYCLSQVRENRENINAIYVDNVKEANLFI